MYVLKIGMDGKRVWRAGAWHGINACESGGIFSEGKQLFKHVVLKRIGPAFGWKRAQIVEITK